MYDTFYLQTNSSRTDQWSLILDALWVVCSGIGRPKQDSTNSCHGFSASRWRSSPEQLFMSRAIWAHLSSVSSRIYKIPSHWCGIQTDHPQWQHSGCGKIDYLSWTLHLGRPPANVDIVSFLSHLLSDFRCRVQIKWVKSHQDYTSGQSKISMIAVLNVKADQLASEFLKQWKNTSTGGPQNNSEHFEWIQTSLLVNGSRIHSSSTGRAMQEHIRETRHKTYFRANHNLREARWQNIDWKGLFAAFQPQTQNLRS